MIHYGDITKMDGSKIPPVDVITFGSPCQDLSIAGQRKGLKHKDNGDEETTRSGLFFEAVRVIKEMREGDRQRGRTDNLIRPRFIIFENVAGIFSSNKGEDFKTVLQEIIKISEKEIPELPLSDIGGGWNKSGFIYDSMGEWSVAWRLHDAQWWGVPQRRKRLALLADFGGSSAGQILFGAELWGEAKVRDYNETVRNPGRESRLEIQPVNESLSGDFKPRETEREETSGGIGDSFDTTGEPLIIEPRSQDGHARIYTGGVIPTLNSAQGGQRQPCVMDNVKCLTPWDCQSKRQYEVNGAYRSLDAGHGNGGQAHGILDNRKSYCLQGNGIDRADNAGCNGRGWAEDVSYTLNTIDRPAVFSFDSLSSNSMKSGNPHSDCRKVDVAKTLDCFDPDPSKNQGGVAVVQPVMVLNDQGGSQIEVTQNKTNTLRAQEHGHQPIVAYGFDGNAGSDAGSTGFTFEGGVLSKLGKSSMY